MKANIPDASYAVYRALAVDVGDDDDVELIDEPTEDNKYVISFIFRGQKYEVRLTAVRND